MLYAVRQRHDVGAFFWPLGSWEHAPPWLRKLVRSGPGAVHIWSLMCEVWGIAMLMLSFAVLVGAVPASYSVRAFTYAAIASVLPFALSAAVILIRLARGERPAPSKAGGPHDEAATRESGRRDA